MMTILFFLLVTQRKNLYCFSFGTLNSTLNPFSKLQFLADKISAHTAEVPANTSVFRCSFPRQFKQILKNSSSATHFNDIYFF